MTTWWNFIYHDSGTRATSFDLIYKNVNLVYDFRRGAIILQIISPAL